MERLRGVLLHIGVVCSFACIIAKVLDWYNPYMDFSGHIWFIQIILLKLPTPFGVLYLEKSIL